MVARTDDRLGSHTGVVLTLLGWWGFGNLYEAIVVMPWLSQLPPGSLPGEFEAGSPVLYFVPAGAALLPLIWFLVLRVHRGNGHHPRAVLWAACLVTLAAAGTGFLVVGINPTFRDPSASIAELNTAILRWEAANAVRLGLAATAAIILIRWRRMSTWR